MDLMYTTIYNQYFMEKLYGYFDGSHVFPQRLATKNSRIIFVWSTGQPSARPLSSSLISTWTFCGSDTRLTSPRGVESEGILIIKKNMP